MIDVSPDQLERAVKAQHGGRARFHSVVAIDERHDRKTAWQGEVHVFDLEGRPRATRAYAWSSPIERSDRRKFYAVLGVPPINSAVDAVRAAIVAETRTVDWS
jgi:hypothetical protein